jgi:hypothetical protein
MSLKVGGVLLLLVGVLAGRGAMAEPMLPVLRYDPPVNFYRSAIQPPDDYAFNEAAAWLQVYPFRPFTGDIQQMFRRTLLREWIDPRFREGAPAAPPTIGRDSVPGAQAVLIARFSENVGGPPKPRLRVVLIAGGAAAIVDLSAQSAASWERAWPAMSATLASLRVDAVAGPPSVASGPGAAGQVVAGLYLGTLTDYRPNLQRPVGQGDAVRVLQYYLLSADGRVYRGFDLARIPGGDVSRFDYEAAQRDDPDNTGRYTVQGEELRIRMGRQLEETMTAAMPRGNRLVINNVGYLRQ